MLCPEGIGHPVRRSNLITLQVRATLCQSPFVTIYGIPPGICQIINSFTHCHSPGDFAGKLKLRRTARVSPANDENALSALGDAKIRNIDKILPYAVKSRCRKVTLDRVDCTFNRQQALYIFSNEDFGLEDIRDFDHRFIERAAVGLKAPSEQLSPKRQCRGQSRWRSSRSSRPASDLPSKSHHHG